MNFINNKKNITIMKDKERNRPINQNATTLN